MKIAVISDTHFGVRGESNRFHDNMEMFFNNIFFKLVKEYSISHIIHVGDVFDNRRKIDTNTAKRAREYFFDPIKAMGVSMDIIAGNHDLYKKESSDVNSLREFLSSSYDNIFCYTEAIEKNGLLYVPWINKDNRDRTLDTIQKSKAKIVFGHLELNGYNFSKVQVAHHGDDPALFKKFEHVYSGHFHHKHTRNNITYLGAPTEHTWIDYNDPKGFHIFDTETHEMEFIRNGITMFEYIDYPETPVFDSYNKFFRINVQKVDKQSELDLFVSNLEEKGAYDVKIITKQQRHTSSIEQRDDIEIEDTITLLKIEIEDENLLRYTSGLYQRVLDLYK